MSLLAWFLVIFLTFIALYLGVGWLLDRGNRELERLRLLAQLDEATANVQLPRAGYLPVEYAPGPPFASAVYPDRQTGSGEAFNTGPMLLLSDKAAANVALEREVKAMIEAAEREIGPTP